MSHAGLGYYTYQFLWARDGNRLSRSRLQHLPVRVGQVRLQHLMMKAKTDGGMHQPGSEEPLARTGFVAGNRPCWGAMPWLSCGS